jgi:hypothetical protein
VNAKLQRLHAALPRLLSELDELDRFLATVGGARGDDPSGAE